MLRELHIENVAIIERADIAYREGFNVMTGETGAGKSIVIDSMNAVLGGRTSRELVRHGADKASVTAVFDGDAADNWLRENDIDPEDELILKRTVSAEGKSSCRVNGMPVSVQSLRELGGLLLNIHGQNDGRKLMDEASHLDYLDAFGGYTAQLEAFRASYETYRKALRKMQKLVMDEDEKMRIKESLEYRIHALGQANLTPGEEAQLEAKADLMRNAEKLSENLGAAFTALYDGEYNALGLIADAKYAIGKVLDYAPDLVEAPKALKEASLILDDIAETLRDILGALDFSPEEFDRMESRLAELQKLERKFGTDEEGLIQMLEESRQRLEEIDSSDDLMQLYKKEAAECREKARIQAAKLTEARKKAGEELAERIRKELRDLSMPSVQFVTEVLPVESEDGFTATGGDIVRFLISANAGEKPGRISKIASGGELSRIMLAMKTVFARQDKVPTLVFDEIDTGISGIAAQRVAEKIAALAKTVQIICVTHLPQIAAMGTHNFRISKGEKSGRTFTSVLPLDYNEKSAEIARLQGGEVITPVSLAGARELMQAADDFKATL